VRRADDANRARLRAHHQALRAGAVAPVAHAAEEVAVADAGGREEHVVALDEVVGREHLVEVVTHVERGAALVAVAWPQPPLDRAAQTLMPAAAMTPSGVPPMPNSTSIPELRHTTEIARDVAVLDQLVRPGLATLADDALVTVRSRITAVTSLRARPAPWRPLRGWPSPAR
jgi:hypothetical protein